MARGRKPRTDNPVRIDIMLPAALLGEINLLILDPLTMQPKYGALSEFITQAVRRELDARKGTGVSPSDPTFSLGQVHGDPSQKERGGAGPSGSVPPEVAPR